MQIYLDYNASAPLLPGARAAVVAGLDLLNASSIHAYGRAARLAVTNARGHVASAMGVRPTQVVFTSGATEAMVTALRGTPTASHIVSAIEHDAVRMTVPGANKIPVSADGVIDLAALDALLKNSAAPAGVAVMFVNNETGVIQPIEGVIKVSHSHGALVLVDAVQALGRVDLSPLKGADMIALSAHKLGGPKGVGALILREGLSIMPLMTGGGQEERRRAGTENVAAIMGFGAAIETIPDNLAGQLQLAAWRDAMEKKIIAAIPHAQIFGAQAPRTANTSMIALPGVAAATQLMNLDLAGVAVSSGSACSSGTVKASHVLLAMGAMADVAAAAIRISSGWQTTQQDYENFTRIYLDMAKRLA